MCVSHITRSIFFLLVAGCSIFESEDSSEVQLSVQGNVNVLRRAINVQIEAPGWRKTLTGSDFSSPNAPNYSQSFATPNSGTLQVKFTLKDSIGNQLSDGVISLDLRSDWRWSIDFVLSNQDPFYGCFGCIGHSSFPVDPVLQKSAKDSLFIIWGGNSIKHPVIY